MTENLKSRLAPGAGSGLYRLDGQAGAKAVARVAEAAGWAFFQVDGSKVDRKSEFLAAAGKALGFPKWAGHNWDTFEELVTDLSWLPPAPGYLLLFDRLGAFSSQQPEQLATALDILAAAVATRQRAGSPPLTVLVRGAGQAARRLPAIDVGQTQRHTTGE